MDAVFSLDVGAVKNALSKGANPNSFDPRSHVTPLVEITNTNLLGVSDPSPATRKAGFMERDTAYAKATEITRILFAAGAKIGPYDRSILYPAIANGNIKQVAFLVDKGASVRATIDGYTPTEIAKKYAQESIYNLLVSRGGIAVDSRSSAQLALVQAAGAYPGNAERIEQAIKDGAQINEADAGGRTALVAAMSFPILDPSQALKVYWLLAHGADANHEDKEDLPLHQFIRSNKITLDLKKPTEWRELAEDTLNQLIKAGAKVSGVNEYGFTPLHVAAKNDNVRAAEILITAGAKIMPRDKHGKTPLDYAESAAMIKLLKENGGIER